jgi:rhodanese-related sulfurtransferase
MTVQAAGAALTVSGVKARIAEKTEFALLDLREEAVYAAGHPLFATSLPLGRLELEIAKLIPRRSTPIALYDDGDGLAERAIAKLERFGYTNVAVMAGGVAAWQAAGYELFAGLNVPSKALAEAIEEAQGTPHIDARELHAKIAAGENVVILDSRPIEEFARMSIPGGIDCPGAELVYRAHDFVTDPETFVVVNCAGRTRSIIGAQSLINSGLPNRVAALKNGTMGWLLAGLDLAHGEQRRVPKPSPEGLAKAQHAARTVAERFGVETIDGATLARFRDETAQRNLYIFDVRSPEEYQAGHVADARSAQGGQLVQATDRFVGVRNARIVLIDDDGVRATMTASWLVQLGVGDVYVLAEDARRAEALADGPETERILGLDDARAVPITPEELADVRGNVAIVDLDTSANYRKGHIPGAHFAIRARLASSLTKLPGAQSLVLTSANGTLARLAASEAAALVPFPVKVLAGGTRAWVERGLPLETGATRLLDDPVDVLVKPHERPGDTAKEMREYLQWETGLGAQLRRDGDAPFVRLLGP